MVSFYYNHIKIPGQVRTILTRRSSGADNKTTTMGIKHYRTLFIIISRCPDI